ncbi:DUF4255 domain-containing protein [Roseomonas aerophila]|uniref:DUF4255 domain-containing protein n=1 Tax=Teichococcus aerophilus TaxID=1224513 RepID=A0ABR7RQJ5_9PROT|nr:DUF4255 domain-containing protein [Pseudoroseomonas aerophila]MBC9208859.1 DUF4255 domain-containing protein [Pseudoroseomonas aerophila]
MSNFNAIASVTAALRARILEVVQADVPGAGVTTLRPGDAGVGGLPVTGVNIFLYRAVPNPAYRGQELPVRRADGAVAQRPRVALDLDYLLCFYGEANLASQRLLASTLRSLHARPVLTPAMIQAAEAGGTPSGLDQQQDPVRLALLDLTLEDLSKLWSVFFQTRYVLSAACRAGAVLVEAALTPLQAPLVREVALRGVPLRRPLLRRVVPLADADAAITAGTRVAIEGERLRGEAVQVLVGGAQLPPEEIRDDRLVVTLPANLRAGAQGLRIRHDVLMGVPPTPRPGEGSNLAAFTLHPAVRRTGGAFDVVVIGATAAGGVVSAGITVGVSPAVMPGQTATLELTDTASAAVWSTDAPPRTAALTTLAFDVAGLTPGAYNLRIRVDGAESALERDTTPGSPTEGEWLPRVVLP